MRNKRVQERDRFARDLESGGIADAEQRDYYGARIAEIDAAVAEYDRLRAGDVVRLLGEGVLEIGDVLIKARVARGMSLKELGERMGGEDPVAAQQVGRYEDEGWRRAGLWRLRQAADALGLRIRVEADLEPLDEARAGDEGAG